MAGPFESILNNMRESFADGGLVIAKRGLVDGPGGYSGRKPLPILPKHRRIALKVYNKPFEELSQRVKGNIRDNTITEKSIPLGTNEERKQKSIKKMQIFIKDFKKKNLRLPSKQEVRKLTNTDFKSIIDAIENKNIPTLPKGKFGSNYKPVDKDMLKLNNNKVIRNLYKEGKVPTLSQIKTILKVDDRTAANRIAYLAEAYLGTRPVDGILDRFPNAQKVLNNADFDYDIRSSQERDIVKSVKEPRTMSSARQGVQRSVGNIPYNVDEVAGIASSSRNKTAPYGVFGQLIKEKINKLDKRNFDTQKAKKEKILQTIIKKGTKDEIKKAVKEFNRFVDQEEKKLNKKVKPGQLKVRLFKASLDKPEKSIKNFKTLPKDYQKAFQKNYQDKRYSFKVPKDIKTIFQIEKDLKDPKTKSEVLRRSKTGNSRLYSFPGVLAETPDIISDITKSIPKGVLNAGSKLLKGLGVMGNAALPVTTALDASESFGRGATGSQAGEYILKNTAQGILNLPTALAGAGEYALDALQGKRGEDLQFKSNSLYEPYGFAQRSLEKNLANNPAGSNEKRVKGLAFDKTMPTFVDDTDIAPSRNQIISDKENFIRNYQLNMQEQENLRPREGIMQQVRIKKPTFTSPGILGITPPKGEYNF